mgnify:CR=1 FL=1
MAKIYNYNIMLHTITEGITDINDIIETITESHVDGVIVYNDKLSMPEMDKLSKYNIPIVIIGNRVKGDHVRCVYVDIEKAIRELTLKYLEEGKKDIAVLEDRKNKYATEQMVGGAESACPGRGLERTAPDQHAGAELSARCLSRRHLRRGPGRIPPGTPAWN